LRPNKILVAPLDWGLGHATRCIPLINELLALGQEVLIATDGLALEVLKQEYPQLQAIKLRGYHPIYPEGAGMVMAMGRQLPKFMSAIAHEKQELKRLIKEHDIQAVISDNRYGLGTDIIPSVLITHQVNLRMPFAALQWGIDRLNRHYINTFSECWVPDLPPPDSIAGELSDATKHKGTFRYLGTLSRLKKVEIVSPLYKALVLLSGPEPQRTALEKIILKQLQETGIKALVARGIPGGNGHSKIGNSDVYDYLDGKALMTVLSECEMVIARSGYSTIMDLVSAGKQALLVPTPGQTEQEYLAQSLKAKGWFNSVRQDKIDLLKDIPESLNYRFEGITSEPLYKQVLRDWVERL
jgi:UDP:flavonoid glycosyltransferase YjiC (YdhE family)